MVRLNEFVRVYDDVLSKESCETLIKIFDDNSDKHERLDQQKKPSFTQYNLTANSADYTDIHNLLIQKLFSIVMIIMNSQTNVSSLNHMPLSIFASRGMNQTGKICLILM